MTAGAGGVTAEPADTAHTGDQRVDAAVAGLAELDALPVGDHVARYDGVHAALHKILNAVDEE